MTEMQMALKSHLLFPTRKSLFIKRGIVSVASSARLHRKAVLTLVTVQSTLLNRKTATSLFQPRSSACFSCPAGLTDLCNAARVDWELEEILKIGIEKLRKEDEWSCEKRKGEKLKPQRNWWKANVLSLREKEGRRNFHFIVRVQKSVGIKNIDGTSKTSKRFNKAPKFTQRMLRDRRPQRTNFNGCKLIA